MHEIWKPIEGFEGYEVSNLGQVRSKHRILKPILAGKGYFRVGLSKDCFRHQKEIHVLVCTAFNGPRPSKAHWALHRNDIKTDNLASNLYWGTQKDNVQDGLRNKVYRHRASAN
jgi:hypothetical protein